MRCADFGPMPGRRRSASVRNARLDGDFTFGFDGQPGWHALEDFSVTNRGWRWILLY
jgi:hypothetical protein